jgi:pimeloyl-ACP methyl ester carboxylesterase
MELELKELNQDPEQQYYLYAPHEITEDTEVFVSIHGISLNARSHAEHFLPYARAHNMVLAAPLFSQDRFSDYNCLGLTGKGERSDEQFFRILDDITAVTGVSTEKIYLFGYSAGGQFAHRFALAYPDRVKKLCLGAPGFFTMPDETSYPLGTNGLKALLGRAIDLDAFLNIPVCLTVGAKDIHRDASLFQSEEVDRLQGLNRNERGLAWFNRIVSLAGERGFHTEYLFKTLPGCPHGFEICMSTGHMGDIVFAFIRPDNSAETQATESYVTNSFLHFNGGAPCTKF